MAETDDYLDVAVDRIVGMYQAKMTALGQSMQVQKFVELGLPAPFIWIYPGGESLQAVSPPAAHEQQLQTWLATARIVLGTTTTGYDGVLASKLWLWMPSIVNYFTQRRRLVYAAGQQPPRYLEPERVQCVATPFGDFSNFDHVGIEIVHTLPFLVNNEDQF